MTVFERDCCRLLYGFFKKFVSSDEIDKKTVNCGMNAYLLYKQVMNKDKNNLPLSLEEDKFVNHFYYANERLLMYLDLEIKKFINNLTKEIETFIKLFENYNDSIEFRNNVYFYRPFKYDNFEFIKLILSKLYNFDINIEFYDFIKLFINSEELMNNYNVLLKTLEKFDFNKCKRKTL